MATVNYGLKTLTSLPNRFATQNKLDAMYAFYLGDYSDLHIIDSTEETANMTLEDIAANINWLSSNKETLKEYLADYGPGSNNESILISSTQEAETTETSETSEINMETSETILLSATETTDVETTEEANDASYHGHFAFILSVGFVIYD